MLLPLPLGRLADDADEVRDPRDHAASRRRIFEHTPPMQLVEAETDQGLSLDRGTAVGARDLLNRNGFLCCHLTSPLCHVIGVPPRLGTRRPIMSPCRPRPSPT